MMNNYKTNHPNSTLGNCPPLSNLDDFTLLYLYPGATTTQDSSVRVNSESTVDISVTINVRSNTWTIPDEWSSLIEFSHDRPDRRTVKQLILKPELPMRILKQLNNLRFEPVNIGVNNWYRLVSREQFSDEQLLAKLPSLEQQIQRKEFWTIVGITRDFYKIIIYIQTSHNYELWRKQSFRTVIDTKQLDFMSCARYKKCQQCNISYTNSHSAVICRKYQRS